jgi:phage-related protein
MAAFDIFLIVLVFIVLIGFLVVIIAYGASIAGQVAALGSRLQVAIQQAFITFQALVGSVVSSLQGFSDTAVKALTNVGAKVGQGFGAVATFFSDQVLGLVENITQEVVDTAGSFARMITKGFVAATTTAADVINELITWVGGVLTSIFGLISRAFTLVSQFISALIIIIVKGVTEAINFVLDELLALIELISGGITISVQAIKDAITELQVAIKAGFSDLESIIGTINDFIQNTLYSDLGMAFTAVIKAITNMFSGFMCSVLAPFCSKLPSFIAPSSLCDDIREAGGCP